MQVGIQLTVAEKLAQSYFDLLVIRIRYLPKIYAHVLLFLILLWLCSCSISMNYFPIFFRVASLAWGNHGRTCASEITVGWLYDRFSASELTLKDMGKINMYLATTEA